MDLAKVHVASRVVGCGRALGHRGIRLIGGHGKGELARDVGRGQALGSLELLGAGERSVNGVGAVDVLEHGLDATVVRLCRQGTVAVVDDDDLKAKARLRGSNTLCCERGRVLKRRVVNGPRKLGIRVGADGALGVYQIGEHLGRVMQSAKAHLAVNVGNARTLDGFLLARIGDAKVELAVGQRTTGQGLGGDNLRKLAARVIGRCTVAVDERNHGALDRSGTSLVLGYRRSLVGVANNGRRGGERTSAIVGDSDRHGALGVVVGVTGLAVVLLGNGVCKGLARVSLRKLDLMASQDVDQTNRCLCRCRGLVHVGALVQAERDGRSLVGRRHGKGELTLGHGTSGEGLAELEAAGRGVIELRAVRVGEAAAFLLGDVGGQDALAVISHGHFGGRDMSVIRHACRAARVLADLVLVGSSSRVVDLAELDGCDAVLRVILAHGHGCGVGQRGALGGGDGKAELVGVRPVATVDGLAQVKVELCVERGHAVSVLESCGLDVVLQGMLRLERAVAVVRDGGLDAVLGIAVGDTAGVALDLAQRIGVRSGLGVLDGAHRNLAIGDVLAGGNDLGVLALALDELEGELAGSKLASGQDLIRGDLVGDAELVRIRLVAVVELRLVDSIQDMLRLERAVALVGDGRLNGVGLAVVGDAVVGVARDLAQRVGMLAGSGVLDGAHLDLAAVVILAGGDNIVALDELEGELAFLEIAPGQDLGRRDLISNTEALGGYGVGVLEGRLVNILQLVLHAEGAIVVILDGGHNSVLSGAVSNAVFGGAGLGLAQYVGVLASRSVGDGIHYDLAVGIVGTGGDHVIALDELETEIASLEVAPVQDLVRGDQVGDAGALGGHVVGVLELGNLDVLQDMLRLERAVAVVRDGGLDGVLGVTVGDALAGGSALDLAQRIGVRSGLGVLDGAHRDLAIGGVLAGGNDLDVLALALDELEGELALSHVAAGQDLGRGDLVGDARLDRRHAVGIGERKCHIAVRLAGHPQIALAVIGHGEGNRTRRLGVVGHASDLAGFGHGVGKGMLALLGLLAQSLVKVVERKGDLAKVDLALGIIGHARVRGQGCALFTGHGKGELAGNVSRGQASRNQQILLAHKRCLGRLGSVGVHKLVAGIAVDSRRRQGTIAVVDNGYICVNYRHGGAHARRQLVGLLGSNVANGPRGLV